MSKNKTSSSANKLDAKKIGNIPKNTWHMSHVLVAPSRRTQKLWQRWWPGIEVLVASRLPRGITSSKGNRSAAEVDAKKSEPSKSGDSNNVH